MYRYFKRINNTDYISSSKSKGFSEEIIKSLSAPNSILDPLLGYFGIKTRVKLNGSCLKQYKITLTHGTIVNIYIVYEIYKNYPISNNPTLENCLLGAVKLTKKLILILMSTKFWIWH